MTTTGIESKTYYLDGIFLYSDYDKLKTAFQQLYTGEQPAGICFVTTKSMPTETTFFSTGIKALLVRFVPGATSGLAAINFMDVENAATVTALQGKHVGTAAEKTSYTNDLLAAAKKAVSPLQLIDWWNDTLYYHKTNEFDYAYIDRNTFEYLASPTEMGFYPRNGSGEPIDSLGNIIATTSRGVHFSRAMITMEKGSRIYGDYRTLKLRPHPEPVMQAYDSRPSIAYHMTTPCPPIWSNDGTSSVSAAAAAPAAMAFSTQDPPPPTNKDCTCNLVNMTLLHQSLKKEGIIPEDLGPAYAVDFRPITIATALSCFFMLLALVGQNVGKNTEGIWAYTRTTVNALALLGLAFILYILVQLYRRIAKGF